MRSSRVSKKERKEKRRKAKKSEEKRTTSIPESDDRLHTDPVASSRPSR
jgi:hypothetical protein